MATKKAPTTKTAKSETKAPAVKASAKSTTAKSASEKTTATVKESPNAKSPAKTATVTKAEAVSKATSSDSSNGKAAKAKVETVQFKTSAHSYDQIAVRAYLIWINGGCNHGNDVQDWLRAEAELISNN